MKRIGTEFIIVACSLLLSGCCCFTSFRLDNRTGKRLDVLTSHGAVTNKVEIGKAVTIPHTSGEVRVRPEAGLTWRYPNVDVPKLRVSGCVEFWNRWVVAGPSIRLHLVIDAEGRLFALPLERKDRQEYQKHQPEGYPLKPELIR